MNPTCAHVVPFAAWLALMYLLGFVGLSPAAAYVIRAVISLMLLFWCRPWQWYERPDIRHWPKAAACGLAVFGVWVFFESRWCPAALGDFYEKWAVLPMGRMRDPITLASFHPGLCGWPLTLARWAGSAFVISIIEEFFWRGFLYRWMFSRDFLRVDPARFDRQRFLLVAIVFGFEHNEWLAGFVAGAAYGWLYLKTRDIWACCVAHVVTNLALGGYVIAAGAWQFW